MRTTLDLDERVLAAARSKAQADGTSLGRAVSELALAGLSARGRSPGRAGFPVVKGAPGHVLSDELVEQLRDGE